MTATTLRTQQPGVEPSRATELPRPREAALDPIARVQQIRDDLLAEIHALLAGQPLDLQYCSIGTLARIRADLIRARQPAAALAF